MKKYILLIFVCLLLIPTVQAKKIALIIAIGEYPASSGWPNIKSENDVELISQTLINQKFAKEDIVILKNKQATKAGIEKAFKELIARARPGDIVVVHYSGHGQQIYDDNCDEADGLDEAIVPYDARAFYTEGFDEGENHIRDDQLGKIVENLRLKIGKEGQLLFILDSCHSGTATRGDVVSHRGTKDAFVPEGWTQKEQLKGCSTESHDDFEGFVEIGGNPKASPFILLTGASAGELNHEYEKYGSLSYSFSKAMNELGSDVSYRQLFAKIAAIMKGGVAPKQEPTIEGGSDADLNLKLFKGEYVQQQTYYEVTEVDPKRDLLTINGGTINGIFKHTTVYVMPAGAVQADSLKAITTGKVAYAEFNRASILLDKNVPDTNYRNYWIFINQPSYGDMRVNVYFETSVDDKKFIKGIADSLKYRGLGEVVSNINESDIVIDKIGNKYSFSETKGDRAINEWEKGGNTKADLTTLSRMLATYASGTYLKQIHFDDSNYDFDITFIPVVYDRIRKKVQVEEDKDLYNRNGVLEIKENTQQVMIEVTNKSTDPIYIGVIEITNAGKITSLVPGLCNVQDDDMKIEPGATHRFRCILNFSIDNENTLFEENVVKAFASNQPLNFQSSMQTRGPANDNPLEKFLISNTDVKTRSANGGQQVEEEMKAYSKEFVYKVVK